MQVQTVNKTSKTSKTGPKVPFNRLTREEKRVAIAKDVLAQIKAKRFEARCGIYVSGKAEPGSTKEPFAAAPKEIKKCNVCALGSLFMAKGDLVPNTLDRLEIYDGFIGSERPAEQLGAYFSQDQLDLIESAFEGADYSHDGTSYREIVVDRFYGWEASQEDQNELLKCIMANIVRNRGTFVIEDTRGFRARTPFRG